MRKKKVRIRPFRILSVLLGIAALTMMARFPEKAVSVERQQTQLHEAAEAYYNAQSRNNQLTTALAESSTVDFVERMARRDHGYCWYGEVIYEVGNLDEIAPKPAFEVYGEN